MKIELIKLGRIGGVAAITISVVIIVAIVIIKTAIINDTEEYISSVPVSGLTFDKNTALKSAGAISDSKLNGNLTVDVQQGEAV